MKLPAAYTKSHCQTLCSMMFRQNMTRSEFFAHSNLTVEQQIAVMVKGNGFKR